MKRLRDLFNRIIRRLRGRNVAGLDAAALEKAMEEARFLHRHYAVDAKALAPGEEAAAPRRADDINASGGG